MHFSNHAGFCGGQRDTGTGFSQVLRCSPVSIIAIAPPYSLAGQSATDPLRHSLTSSQVNDWDRLQWTAVSIEHVGASQPVG
jgi:hypothetical protein